MRFIALAAAALLAAAGHAAEPPGSDYVVAGFRYAEDWQFVAGPRNGAAQGMKLTKTGADGSIGFICKTDGTRQFGIALRGLGGKPGDTRRVSLAVGTRTATVEMRVGDAPEEGQPAEWRLEGGGVSQILEAMRDAPTGAGQFLSVDAGGDASLSVALPEPRGIAAWAAEACGEWARMARQRQEPAAGPAGNP